jgi:hypothetical protein
LTPSALVSLDQGAGGLQLVKKFCAEGAKQRLSIKEWQWASTSIYNLGIEDHRAGDAHLAQHTFELACQLACVHLEAVTSPLTTPDPTQVQEYKQNTEPSDDKLLIIVYFG